VLASDAGAIMDAVRAKVQSQIAKEVHASQVPNLTGSKMYASPEREWRNDPNWTETKNADKWWNQ
jgi:hypothetical protein